MNHQMNKRKKLIKSRSIRKVLLLICLNLISVVGLTCGNEYGHKVDGSVMHSRFFYLTPGQLKFDTVKLKKQITDYDNQYWQVNVSSAQIISQDKDQALSNKALALMKLGKVKEARAILEPLVRRNQNEYTMCANLGTVYELSGELDSALKYISRGLELNSNSHWGSEWIHVELLNAKIKRKRDKNYILNNRILSDELLESNRDTAIKKRFRRNSRILRNIYMQARTRARFTPAPNEVMCNLLLSAGDFAQKNDTYENAFMAFAYARKYAKGYIQRRESEKKIIALNKLRDVLSHDKALESMFFYAIKSAQINPKLLLMGLVDISESLDSVNNVENKYKAKIDSLEEELRKPFQVFELEGVNEFVHEKEDEDERSDTAFYVIISALVISTVFFAVKGQKRT